MHKFLRAAGFSDINKKGLKQIIKDIIAHPEQIKVTSDSEGNEFAELSRDFAPGIGIMVRGTYEDNDEFQMEYYYPYLRADELSTQEQIEIQKHSEKESYAGISDELSLGVTLIFYMQNVAEYLSEKSTRKNLLLNGAKLSSLAIDGKILLPVEKKEEKQGDSYYKYQERNRLLSQARDGDEDAIESLTLEDMDTYSIVSRRVMYEDILSIVTSYFMPYGIESDQYSILGEILNYKIVKNYLTKEILYCMKVECNDIIFDVCINEKDLLGKPEIGRRFKGNVWMQGRVCL